MKVKLLLIGILFINQLLGQELSIASWNLKDFGQSRDDTEIKLIAQELRNADIVAIQEVVAKHPGGVQAVARLANQLNRMGANWDYAYTDPTGDISPHKKERYAFLWKTSKANIIKRVQLIKELDQAVCREPAIAEFMIKDHKIAILNYHACTHNKSYPEREEIQSITQWLNKSNLVNVIWCGDMNLKIDDIAFESAFEIGYSSVLNGQKTSLKMKCIEGDYLSRAEDNVLYKLSTVDYIEGVVQDYISKGDCNDVTWQRNSYSDHLPVLLKLAL